MTVPTLMNNTKDKENITALKKSYSIISQAYLYATAENGSPNSWDFSTQQSMMNYFRPYLKVTKDCGTETSANCWASGNYLRTYGTNVWIDVNALDQYKLLLADGSSLATNSFLGVIKVRGTTTALKNVYGEFWVDVNGHKGPNRLGIDTFEFYLTINGIIPLGTVNDTAFRFATTCEPFGSANPGAGCTAWALYNENEDYAKCDGLAWGGATTCP